MDPIISEVFEPHRVAKILAEIWGREHGCEATLKLTPKEGATSAQQDDGG